MEISESIYEGVVTPYYKNTTRAESNHTVLSRNREKKLSRKTLTLKG